MNKKKSYILRLVLFLVIILGLEANAQNFRVGPEVGYERCGHYLVGNVASSTHNGNGFRIGASAAYEFGNGPFIQSGLFYSHHGGSRIYGVNDIQRLPYIKDIELNSVDFLTLPLTLGYELPFCSRWGVGIEAGGYIAAGLRSGSSYFRCSNGEGGAGSVFDDSIFTVGMPDGYDRDRITVKGSGRTDAGCMFGAQLRFKRIRLHATYQLGLCKTIYDIAMPRTFILSLAYDFKL